MKPANRVTYCALAFLAASGLGSGAQALPDTGPVTSGTLYYTTFTPVNGSNVFSSSFSYDGATLLVGSPVGLAQTNGADGILFGPDNNLFVSGQNANHISEVTTGGTILGTSGNTATGSYHMAMASNAPNGILYNMWNGSGSGSTAISAITLSGGGVIGQNGIAYTVSCNANNSGCSTDVRGLAFNQKNGKWYYGTADDGATNGDFGTVVFDDVNHTATLTPLLSGNAAAHGLTYDPFTGDIIASSGDTVMQWDPTANAGAGDIVATYQTSNSGDALDQSAATGDGLIFFASNNGNLVFLDFSTTGLISSPDVAVEQFLITSLDDIAPLSGGGSHTVPEPASFAVFSVGLAGIGYLNRRRRNRAAG